MGDAMNYRSVLFFAHQWGLSERSVRNYCASGRIKDAHLEGKTWKIPSDAQDPRRKTKHSPPGTALLSVLKEERKSGIRGGIYHRIQIDLTYNSNHIEGSLLTHDQTRYIYETNTIGLEDGAVSVDDIVETVNHFRCIDLMIDRSSYTLTETFTKQLHALLINGTSDSRKGWFAVGEYKKLPNEVGGRETVPPELVAREMRKLLSEYNSLSEKRFKDILDFHVRFERIHPFQDGNGRVGRLIMFKECLKHGIVPFIISDSMKMYYYRGLNEWGRVNEFLRDACLSAQDDFKRHLEYFRIPYRK